MSGETQRSRAAQGPPESVSVRTLSRALSVLSALSHAERPLSLGDLAHQVGLPKSTVFRLLSELREAGVVAQGSQPGVYRLTAAVWSLHDDVRTGEALGATVQPLLESLAAEVGHSCSFSVLEGSRDRVVVLAQAIPDRPVRVVLDLSERPWVHACAMGRAMVSGLPRQWWRTYGPADLPSATSATVRDWPSHLVRLQRAREDGYAVDEGEWLVGVDTVAVAVSRPQRQPFAAVAVHLPHGWLTDPGPLSGVLRNRAVDLATRLWGPHSD